MTDGLKTIIYPVKDLGRAKALFGALLGVEPYADEPYYVGYRAAGQDVGLDPNGHAKGMTGPVPYWHVSDIGSTLAALVEAGAEPLQDVQEVGGGRRIAFVRDADGNLIGLLQDPPA
ncbi:VOC family protein [Streptomyces sp. NPDC005925]|uniref:VOC family protein n=1 Tax=Streptomyces sp. NPDC005925 TaxID=3157172 RepID=UPI0033D84999